jgi:hypothetical protein
MDGINSAAKPQTPAIYNRPQERPQAPEAVVTAAPTPLPAEPPLEVLAAMDRASQVVHRLEAQGVHLHFDVGQDSKVRIQLIDEQGNVVRQIPQDKALQLLAGGTGGLAVDALG